MTCLSVMAATIISLLVFYAIRHIGRGTLAREGTDCSLGEDHTMCKYKGPRDRCIPGKLTSTDRFEILKAHNQYRSKVASGQETQSKTGQNQPPAADMRRLAYDDELAKVAQRWAEQCTRGHDKNRKDKRFSVGQNMAENWSSDKSTKFDVHIGIDGWYSEVKKFDPEGVKRFKFDPGTGHYTQVVWHNTYLIGCGYAFLQENGVRYFFICNYGPAGNILNAAVYREGDNCTECPINQKTCSESLCGT